MSVKQTMQTVPNSVLTPMDHIIVNANWDTLETLTTPPVKVYICCVNTLNYPCLLQGVMRLTQTGKLSSSFLLVFQVFILHFIIVYGR